MLHFHQSSLIDAPVTVVWEFHQRPDVLTLLTPPWQPVQVVRRQGGLDVGAETEFLLGWGVFSLRWLARHVECKPYELFVDRQVTGPFAKWLHWHQFEEEQGKTQLTDTIAFALPGGEAIESLAGSLVMAQLDSLFRYRHQVTKQYCERSSPAA